MMIGSSRTLMYILCVCIFRSTADFICKSGTQIIPPFFCDWEKDCVDGSDEIATDSSCSNCSQFETSCSTVHNKTCILHREFICNGTIQCTNVSPCDLMCPDYYRCHGSSVCSLRSHVCDGNSCNDCPGETEWETGPGFKCNRNAKKCILPQAMLKDQIKDCDNGEDLCFSEGWPSLLNTELCFQCFDNVTIIPKRNVCDGKVDCPDLSDECPCQTPPDICKNITYFKNKNLPKSGVSQCNEDQLSCEPDLCINRSQICDGVKDCLNGTDESYLFCEGTLKCTDATPLNKFERCRCDKECSAISGTLCDGVGDCPPPGMAGSMWHEEPGFPDDECWGSCNQPNQRSNFNCTHPITIPDFSFVGVNDFDTIECREEIQISPDAPSAISFRLIRRELWCDGVIDCPFSGKDEEITRCPGRFRCPSGNLISIPMSSICDGEVNCDDGRDESNETCSGRFYCPVLDAKKISIDQKHVCDFKINCDDASDEMNCSTAERFYCESGSPLFIPLKQMYDGKGECSDWSDECPTTDRSRDSVFSSKYELISNPVLRAFVWIMAFMAIAGNLCVLYSELQTIIRYSNKPAVSCSLRANHLLVLNLALSDLIMGIYLLLLGSAGAFYSGVYCANKLYWLSSTLCDVMGVMVVTSSEMSVLTMVMLTALRLYAVLNPFYSSTRPQIKVVIFFISATWFFSLFLSLLPLSVGLQGIFVGSAVMRDNPFFDNVVVDFQTTKNLAERLYVFDRKDINSSSVNIEEASSWKELQNAAENALNHPEYLTPSMKFGYYSANSVCIPNLFVTSTVPAWGFTFFLMILNLGSFLFVFFAYIAIYIKSSRTKLVKRTSKGFVRTSALEKKIVRLIASDFCCWVPVSVIGFISIGGIPVPDIAYVVSAAVLLPINSALNPLFYSTFIDRMLGRIWRNRESFTSRNDTGHGTKSSASTRV